MGNSEIKSEIRVLQIMGVVCAGGIESVIMNYYRNIDREKVQFDFVIDGYEKSLLDDEINLLGGKVYKVEPYKKNIFKYVYQIYKIVKNNNYKIVHSNMNTLSVFSLFAAWLGGAKIRVIHNHSTAIKNEKIRSLIKYLLRPFAPAFANRYVACSKFAGEWMFGKKAIEQGNIRIINNAIDLDKFSYNEKTRKKMRSEFNIKEDTLVIGHVGRFVHQKNHDFLIELFKEVNRINKNCILVCVGDGPLKQNIEEKVKKYKIDKNVKFLGIRKNVNELYNMMDLFLLPSWYEGLPVVSIEVQANGLKAIISDKVSLECKVMDNIEFLSLTKRDLWIKNIINTKISTVDRGNNALEKLSKSGFNIKENSKILEQDIYS